MLNIRINLFAVSALLFTVTNAQADTSFKSTGNPIVTHKYTADPAALVYNSKVYL